MSESIAQRTVYYFALIISVATIAGLATGLLEFTKSTPHFPDYRIVQYVNPDGKVYRSFQYTYRAWEEHVPLLCTDVVDSTNKVDYHWEDELAPMTDSIQQERIRQARDLVTKLRRFQQLRRITQ
jgi:hypothetical protein